MAAADAGARLDRFLAEHELIGSRGRAERLIELGLVSVDGSARPKSFRLPAGAVVSFTEPAPPPPVEPGEVGVPVVYADDHLLASIDGALARIDEGSYGVCANCGRTISRERLDALPYATKCIDCKRLEERG